MTALPHAPRPPAGRYAARAPTGPHTARATTGPPQAGAMRPTAWTLEMAGGGRMRVERCLVMGILNATPDSFSDGGALGTPVARDRAIGKMLAAGADVLDIGGESTRPGHTSVSAADEMARVLPVIKAVRRVDGDVPISIDTQKAVVAAAALRAGASFVNDVSGLADPWMAEVLRRAACSVVLMRRDTIEGDLVAGCRNQLQAVVARAQVAGVPAERIIVDPGLGFGGRPGAGVADNLALIDQQTEWSGGFPVLIGASRKRFVGAWAGKAGPAMRDEASARLARRARDAGAAIVRVHDVARTVAALQAA